MYLKNMVGPTTGLILILVYCARAEFNVLPLPETTHNGTRSLQDYICSPENQVQSNTVVVLSPGTHYIQPGIFCLVSDKINIGFHGSTSGIPAVIHCNGSSDSLNQTGFGFHNVVNLTFKNVWFENCGGMLSKETLRFVPNEETEPFYFGRFQKTVLLLTHCFDVYMENVTITNYHGYGIYTLNLLGNSVFRTVNISHSFSNLRQINDTDLSTPGLSGSGMVFYYMDNKSQDNVSNPNNSLVITQCIFLHNTYLYPRVYRDLLVAHFLSNAGGSNLPRVPTFGFGSNLPLIPAVGSGGLTLYFYQQSFDVTVMVNNSLISRNSGNVGGGVFVLNLDTLDHSFVTIDNCTFHENSVLESVFTGAALKLAFLYNPERLYSTYLSLSTREARKNPVLVTNSVFSNNRAVTGGAVWIYSTAQNVSYFDIIFHRVSFTNNKATVDGDCMQAVTGQSVVFGSSNMNILLSEITAEGSGAVGQQLRNDVSGAFSFTNLGTVSINGTGEYPSIFRRNDNSALLVSSTPLLLTGTIEFANNTASSGAAIHLNSNSLVFIQDPANITFSKNRAAFRGGAIYSEASNGQNRQCVFQFITLLSRNKIFNIEDVDQLNITMVFTNNSAESGKSIFASPLYNCSWYPESVLQTPRDAISRVYQTLFDFPDLKYDPATSNTLAEVRSNPVDACFCNQSSDQIECFDPLSETVSWTYPGRTFTVGIVPVDAVKQPVRSLLITRILSKENVIFQDGMEILAEELSGTGCSEVDYSLHYQENLTVSIELSLANTKSIVKTIFVRECPIGFQLDNTSGRCDCIPLFRNQNFVCDIQSATVERPERYWIGLSDHGSEGMPVAAFSLVCPDGYCKTDVDVYEIELLNGDFLCENERTGELCGECKENFSQQFGTTACVKCSNFWLLTIFLYALAGILLVILLFSLRLTVSTGTIIGLIFYAQAAHLDTALFQYTSVPILTVFLALLNLDLGFPICFYDGMDYEAKIGLQFVFPAYLWLMVIMIIVFSRFSSKLQRLTSHASVQVLVTLMYLSYAKLLRNVTEIFVPAYVQTETRTHVVWFHDGSVLYCTGQHLVLYLVSIAVLVLFLIPYQIFFLLSQWCLKYRWINHYKPLIDAQVGAYKDKWRFWFSARLFMLSLMVVFRVTLIATYPKLVIHLQLGLAILFTVTQAYIKPFRNLAINILDLFFMVNFCILLTAGLYVLEGTDLANPPPELEKTLLNSIVYVLVGSVFIAFCGIIAYHTVLVFKKLYAKWHERHPKVTFTDVNLSCEERTIRNMPSESEFDLNQLRESLLEDTWDVVPARLH